MVGNTEREGSIIRSLSWSAGDGLAVDIRGRKGLRIGWGALSYSAAALLVITCWHFRLSPVALVVHGARASADAVLYVYDRKDLTFAPLQVASYIHRLGTAPADATPKEAWSSLEHALRGVRITVVDPGAALLDPPPFVYESPDEPHLTALRQTYSLRRLIAGAAGDYEAILRLGGWVGRQFDHGLDKTPRGRACNSVAMIRAGHKGARFDCGDAASLLVHVAAAVGFAARLLTVSRDGYSTTHGIAEIWSDEFNKWVAVDPDFNVVYETSTGVPLSAAEVMESGDELRRRGLLVIRRIAPPKPHARVIDTVQLYRYLHVDMRTDWCSRILVRGSPASGDFATWWTSAPGLPPLLTVRRHVSPGRFGWLLNRVSVMPLSADLADRGWVTVQFSLSAYAPMFQRFEYQIAGGAWHAVGENPPRIRLPVGRTELAFRVFSASGFPGTPTRILATVDPLSLTEPSPSFAVNSR